MKAEGRAIAIYVNGIFVFLLLTAHEVVFDVLNEVLFIGTNPAVAQGNVTGGWGEMGITILYFAVILILIIGAVLLLSGRGDTG